jgi:crotonobetainyl-CoA:carnitine CoA-transferase CaiB-like acyl-CoA transferase
VPGPLAELVVVDASWGMPGAVASMVLADYGASVVRVERPGGGPDRDAVVRQVWERGKRSVELDLGSASDVDRLLGLLPSADVFIESCGPGRAARLGFGPDVVAELAPALMYCSLSGYGQDGPWSDRPGYDALVAARFGLMAEQAGHRPGPTFLGHPSVGYGTAFLAVISVLAAVQARHTTGRGQHIDVSMLDGVLAQSPMNWWWNEQGKSYLAREGTEEGFGRSRVMTDLFECADGEYIMVHTGGEGGFKRAMDLLGIGERVRTITGAPEMSVPLDDEEYAAARHRVWDAFKSRPRDEWLRRFTAADLAALPVLRPGEVLLDEQVAWAGVVHEVHDDRHGPLRTVGPVIKFAASPAGEPAPAPRVGQHNDALGDLRAEATRRPADVLAARGEALAHPLQGIRVVDLSAFFATAYGAKFLADLGADVVKVEPLTGDLMRPLPEPFEASNRGKRTIAVDLKTPEGREIVTRLAATADVLMHNFRPGKAEKAGIGYEELAKVNPRLVYCYLPGYGSGGPKASLKSFAPLLSGFTGVFFEGAGDGNPPVRRVMGNEDYYNGFLGAIAALAALEHRRRTGRGQYVEMPQLNSSLLVMSQHALDADGKPVTDLRLDADQRGWGPLYRLYDTTDGVLCIACVGDRAFARLRTALDLHELAADLGYSTAVSDDDAAAAVVRAVGDRLAVMTTDGAFALLDGAGVACEVAVADPYLPDFLWDEWAFDTGRVFEHYHPTYGWIREVGTVLHLSETPCQRSGPAALLGEYTTAVLGELGYAPAEIDDLLSRRVCAGVPAPAPASGAG